MMSESEFQAASADQLTQLYDALEPAYEAQTIEDLEMEAGLLTIVSATGKSWIVSAHAPSRQIWLASPVSGGLHFSFDGASQQWKLANGIELGAMLLDELGVTA
jgi:frataxin